jgi:hypothetical protein
MLILALFLTFAYMVAGPAYEFFAKLPSSLRLLYEPRDFEREELLKRLEQTR